MSNWKNQQGHDEPQDMWIDVQRQLQISMIMKGDILSIGSPVPVQSELFNNIMTIWRIRDASMTFPGSCPKENQDFVNDLLIWVNANFVRALKMMIIEQGDAIIVYAITTSRIPVLYIVNVTNFSMNQGRAILYPRLKICFKRAVEQEGWSHPIFGVLTTADRWIFVQYDGEDWTEARPFAIRDVNDQRAIREVVDSVYRILSHQFKLAVPFVGNI